MNVGDLVRVNYPRTSFSKSLTGILRGFSIHQDQKWVVVDILDSKGSYRVEVIPARVEVLSESR